MALCSKNLFFLQVGTSTHGRLGKGTMMCTLLNIVASHQTTRTTYDIPTHNTTRDKAPRLLPPPTQRLFHSKYNIVVLERAEEQRRTLRRIGLNHNLGNCLERETCLA